MIEKQVAQIKPFKGNSLSLTKQSRFQGGAFGREYRMYIPDDERNLLGPIIMGLSQWGVFCQKIFVSNETAILSIDQGQVTSIE